MRRTNQAAIAALALLLQTAHAHAEDRSRSGRARLELSFDHGVGGSTEGAYGELAADLRLHAPEGFGAVLRSGLASNVLSYAFAIDLGVAQRFDLVAFDHVGLQLSVAGGASIGEGPFDRGRDGAAAAEGFPLAHLGARPIYLGVGAVGHALATDRHQAEARRQEPVVSLAGLLRIGGDWGL